MPLNSILRTHCVLRLTVIILCCGLQFCALAGDLPSFSRDIQPTLAKHCVVCHGPDQVEAGLRLDQRDSAISELDSGLRAVVPGKPEESELMRRVLADDESQRMPPEGEPLSQLEIAQLKAWIADGAGYETHWSFQPVTLPSLPDVVDPSWIRNAIDPFVLSRLESEGISPSAEANPATLIKRLYYDLIGLPPTVEQVDAFMSNPSESSYEALVDRLLASEHFGERWGRHWLDMARYADSDGYEKDRPRPNAWRYRDWVIDAMNRDMPFDRFTVEQLAGDLLPNPSPMQQLATAFHRQTLTNTEGGVDQEEFRVEATFDRTETTGAVWLGLTMTCARCHSHKYDQISQKEYYQLYSFFDDANEAEVEVAKNEAALERYLQERRAHDAKVAKLAEKYDAAKKRLEPQVEQWIADMSAKMDATQDHVIAFKTCELLSSEASSRADLIAQEDGSLLVTGPVADTDEYTLILEMPADPLTGLRLEVLDDPSLAKHGPGRAPNGNFVLSEVRVYASRDRDFGHSERIDLVNAEADFSQTKFSPDGALSTADQSGWAISPKMGEAHHWTAYTTKPILREDLRFLKVVLDQRYGGQHTLGRFRLSTLSGFDPLRSLPETVAQALRAGSEKRSPEQREIIAQHVASLHAETARMASELARQREQGPKSPMMTVPVLEAADRMTHVLHRGDFLQPEQEEVNSDAMAILTRSHPLKYRMPGNKADRLDLASWLVDVNHPLTPRVVVNQIWTHLFGRGIVATPNDFGVRGDQPTHPELLDWLAWQFPRQMNWSRKALIKTIVMSATYRQSSTHRQDLVERDPLNLLLARQNRIRVSAEVIRDIYLSVGGLLDAKIGGPSVFPQLPPGVAELSYANNFKWETSQGEDAYRRGMYTFFKRTSPHPTLISFDCPDSNTTRISRDTSNTPLQALVTLNNEVFAEAAQAFARRVLSQGLDGDREKLTYALRLCIAREPSQAEVHRFLRLLNSSREFYRSDTDAANKLAAGRPASEVAVEENAAWIATLRIVLNLDEFIVRD